MKLNVQHDKPGGTLHPGRGDGMDPIARGRGPMEAVRVFS